MTPTIASTLAALSNVGNGPVTVRLNANVYPNDVTSRAITSRTQQLTLDAGGNLTIHSGVDAWRALREFSQELLQAAMQAE
jgi:hypothetical protein